jgi:hypothetical protein
MFIERDDDRVWLRELPVWVVDTLLCLPDWIESDDPKVRKRLMPKAYLDDEQDREWRAALGSSLEHLVATRTEIVRKDLGAMEVCIPDELDEEGGYELQFATQTTFDVPIPASHVPAWVSTLQAGTHALFILEGLTADDLSQDSVHEIAAEKQVSMLRLSVLQEILVHLLE